MRYADLDNLIADYIPEATADEEKAAIGRILDNVSAFVDAFTRRPAGYFAPAAETPTVKRVRGEGQNFLRLPRHVFGSIEEVGGQPFTAWTSRVYESEVSGWLYFESEGVGSEGDFTGGYSCRRWLDGRSYAVKARWGYIATPPPIVEAVRLIVARIYSVQKGTIGQTTAEGFIQEKLIPQAARDLLSAFVKREFER